MSTAEAAFISLPFARSFDFAAAFSIRTAGVVEHLAELLPTLLVEPQLETVQPRAVTLEAAALDRAREVVERPRDRWRR